jgi:glycosyltransferase involved in cell wall biosynthesis
MRVLHVGKYYAPQRGGIERHLQELAEWFVDRGDTVAALVHQAPGHWRSTQERLNGVDLRRVGCLAAPLYTPIGPAVPWQLHRALKEIRPDLLHLHLPNPSCFAALLSPRARRLPWLVHWHADVPPDMPDWRFRLAHSVYARFERAVLARAQCIVATSRAYADASRALEPWRDKVHIVPLGIDASAGAIGAGPAWPPGCRLKLLSVGRLSHYKGHAVLIQAVARIPGAHLVLIGDGEEAGRLRALVADLEIQDRVSLLGDIDDAGLNAAYANADLFVLPSLDRSEAFGLVLLEAMRAGLAIVASDIAGSGVGHVVEDGVTGLLVPPGDVEALAGALGRNADASLRARLGQAGQARWRAEFTLDRSAREIEGIYRRMKEAGPPAAGRAD